jgi:hypothetical protein
VIFSSAYSVVTATTNNFASGLVGTLGVRIIDGTGANIVTRRTTGITEPIATSGFYIASIDLTALPSAPAPGHYFVFWDNGSVTVGNNAAEDLILHANVTLNTAMRVLAQGLAGHNAENINVGLFVA